MSLPQNKLTLGEYVKQYREKHNISQRRFAEMCGLSNGYISILEDGKSPKTGKDLIPKIDSLMRIANATGTTLDELCNIVKMGEETISIVNKAEMLPITEDNLFYMTIGDKIRSARLKKGMTQEELGKILDIQKSAVAKYENGRVQNIKRITLQRISETLDIPISELIFEGKDNAVQKFPQKNATISDRISYALKARQMRPSELCKVAKIPESSLSLYLSGAYEPKQERVYAMAAALNVDVSWLLGYDVPIGTFSENEITEEEKEVVNFFRGLDERSKKIMLSICRMGKA